MTRVLLVEDQRTLAEALAIAIDAQPDLECVGAVGTAEEGLLLARERRPDVVLMDVHLPGADGIDGTRLIKAERPEARIFILTGDATPELFAAAFAAGAAGFLAKDGPFPDVLAAIRTPPAARAMVAGGTFAALVAEFHRAGHAQAAEEKRPSLTRREREVLALMGQDLGARAIAARLGMSEHTARDHVKHILRKLGAHSRREAVAAATRTGLLPAGRQGRPGPSGSRAKEPGAGSPAHS
ncbi:response regulator transcription factor [Actinoallomurus oryzae]|uniref:Response regulator transcription factor n=1 Tax=Actinoallomurus oryzae TaxID=502180 RepID=A0ABP8PJ97_9ACTN